MLKSKLRLRAGRDEVVILYHSKSGY